MRWTTGLSLALASVLLAVGCGDGGGSTTSGTTSSSSSSGGTTTGGGSGEGGSGGAGGFGQGQGGSGGDPGPACGDGMIAGDEACDDGNTVASDGCDASCHVEPGYSCTGAPSACVTDCGDGVVAGTEECDDDGGGSGDGCSDLCVIEPGFGCEGEPSVCAPICGDSVLAGAEACDDGNGSPDDGCDELCAIEPGFGCAGEPSVCATLCGDAILAGLEACDDGNGSPDDGCDGFCAIETGFACDGEPSDCAPVCGDAMLAGLEACDDGNGSPDDGCDELCLIEPGFDCAGEPSTCTTSCGDSIVGGGEACDDGAAMPLDGCDASCHVEPGYACAGAPSVCVTDCGDGIVAGTEECDDDGGGSGDGCSGICLVESGFGCSGAPSVCVPTCGDGILVGAEACDDGDTAGLDGCSATCAVEAGYACEGEPSTCATVCGDGLIAGSETCDDHGSTPGDGCNGACATETGYACAGLPSTCVPICGDGLLLPGEGCDDANANPNDGCNVCTVTSGYHCAGAPSACTTVCGDGILAGAEACDDSNVNTEDGCTSQCRFATGETCSDPLATSQATWNGASYVWSIPSGSLSTLDGQFACDASGSGPDAVIAYTKTSADLAHGGQLLHVAATTAQSATGYYLNVEVSSTCPTTAASSLKCLWYKHDWDSYSDLPAGTYYIWVAKNSPATANQPFPATTVTIDEVAPAAAEGEGCFAPYTTASAIHTPPAGIGLPHTWALPATINSFDMGPTWGAPGSISCDDTAPYGDIHGVDAVVQVDKASASSLLLVEVTNLGAATSNLDMEVLSACDPASPGVTSFACRADVDTHAMTVGGPAGPRYVWVATEATGEEFGGATLKVTELSLSPGDSWQTPMPILGSGPISPTSTYRLDPPTCFPAAGNVHWYSYTLTNDALSIGANAAGALGVLDASGKQLRCTTNALASPLGVIATPGSRVQIAVPSGGPITSLTLTDVAYGGVTGVVTDMMVTFPSSPLTDYGMTVGPTEVYIGGTSEIFAFPKTIGASAAVYAGAAGLTSTHLGYDLVFGGGSLFSVDSTTITSNSRLFRVFDGTTWGPTTWDLSPSYPASSASHAIAFDGTSVLLSTRRLSASASFYSLSTAAPASPVSLGTNTSVWYVTGLAADNQYLYVASDGTGGEGIYRISRANVAAPATKLASINTSTLCTNMELDADVSPSVLYVRDDDEQLQAIVHPGGASVHLGTIVTLGGSSDYAMTYDRAAGAIYMFETETDSNGKIVIIE